MHQIRSLFTAGVVCLLTSCSSDAPKARAIGEAFVGPASVVLRSDLSPRSQKLAELKFGERLEVLQTRRALVKVRNMGGAEGWLDGKNLITATQMAEMQRTVEAAERMPSQGSAKVFDALNVHIEPNRQAPSPFQIPPGGTAEVLSRRVELRVPYRPLVQTLMSSAGAKKAKRKKGKDRDEAAEEEEKPEVPPPPMPPGPPPPDNWQQLSRTEIEPEPGQPQRRSDDWSLVRLGTGKAGWVLSRMLYMNIPDDVAQYSEGKRITSYFSLGDVKDEEEVKHHWLWTTISKPLERYDFDGFRVFIYNVRRHRYETAYRENNVTGYLPVEMHTVVVEENKKKQNVPGFSLITKDEEGRYWKRTFAFLGYRVRLLSKQPAESPVVQPEAMPNAAPPPGQSPEKKPWYLRLTQIFRK